METINKIEEKLVLKNINIDLFLFFFYENVLRLYVTLLLH